MTAPRIPLFQRKGQPPKPPGVVIAISHRDPSSPDNSGPGDSQAGDTPDEGDSPLMVTCPECHVTFDAEANLAKSSDEQPQSDASTPPTGGMPEALAAALGKGGES